MISLEDRALAVLVAAWRLLPPMKHEALLSAVFLEDMGARHGSYGMDDECLGLSTRLFQGENASQLLMIDVQGHSPPQVEPFCSRALHTTLHELAHAIGAGTGLDETQEWLHLGGWVKDDEDPEGTGRYWERRPGWGPHGPSPWRYRLNTWFPRLYSTKSPHECFSDCITHIALGWQDVMVSPNGLAKLRYLRREVWGERGRLTVAAARDRWQARWGLQGVARRSPRVDVTRDVTDIEEETEEEEIEEAVLVFNKTQRKRALEMPWVFGNTTEMTLALSVVIAPLLLRLYQREWQMTVGEMPGMPRTALRLDAPLSAIQQAVQSYVTTTRQALQTALADLPLDATPADAARIVAKVFDAADMRARQLAVTEAHRAAEAGKLAAALAVGKAQWGIWRVQSAKPCSHCLSLDGRRVPLGEAFFYKGDMMQDAGGKVLKLDYGDVLTPPIHPLCACILATE